MKAYRYQLAKYGSQYRKKMTCPSCGKVGRFSPYWDLKENHLCSTEFGRCDRLEGCGYHLRPTADKREKFTPPPLPPELPRIEISNEIVKLTTDRDLEENMLFNIFCARFGADVLARAFKSYKIGTSRSFQPIFWQIDTEGIVRTGKIITYETNGHRSKDIHPKWAHKLMNYDPEKYQLKQCMFGEHLLKGNTKPVAIVESEKTALLMSIIDKRYLWLAVGGANNIEATGAHNTLKGFRVELFPDVGMWLYWAKFAQHYGWTCSDWADDLTVCKGDDILDYYLKTFKE